MLVRHDTFKRILGLHDGATANEVSAPPVRPARGGARDVWARPGMSVTFRAELMPGRSAPERTFRVARVLRSLRVLIEGIAGEHTATDFDLTK